MTGRQCGGCTLCCRLLPVRELDKGANQRCQHQSHRGCKVYRKFAMPDSCRLWSCRWLVDPKTAKLHRPDRTGYVVDIMPDLVRVTRGATTEEYQALQVWCDPHRPDAWMDPALLAYALEVAGGLMIVRFGTHSEVVTISPNLVAHVREASIIETKSGSLLLEKIRGQSVAPERKNLQPELETATYEQ